MTHSPRYLDPTGIAEGHELDAQTRNAVNRQEAAVFQRISGISTSIRDSMARDFDRTHHDNADRYANGAASPEERRLRYAEGRFRAVRASVAGEEFGRVRNVLANRAINAVFLVGTVETQTEVNVDFSSAYWVGRTRNAETVRDAIAGATPAQLADRGVTFEGITPPNAPVGFPATGFTADQAMQIARRALTWNMIRTQLQDGGVSSANVALAVQAARDLPLDDLATALNIGGGNDEEIRTINARITAQSALNRLGAIPRQAVNLAVVIPQIAQLNADLGNVRAGGAMTHPAVAAEYGAILPTPLTGPEQREIRAYINTQLRPLVAIRDAYENMRRESLLVARAFLDRGFTAANLPPILADQRISATGFQDADLTAALEPAAIAAAVRASLNIPESGDALRQELATATTNRDNASNRTFTGRELVQGIYEARFRREEHLADTEAQRAAQELYGRNQMTREQSQYMEQSFATQEVLGSEPVEGSDKLWQMGKEAVWGREEAFVFNLATNINRNMVSVTSRIPTGIRRPYARPNWGRGSYRDLMTAFYAIRDAARKGPGSGDLSNTTYVRRQLNEIGAVLASRHVKEVTAELSNIEPVSERERIGRLGEQAQVRAIIDTMMLQPVPGQYNDRVGQALGYARKWTGRTRKAVGRFANNRYRNVRHGEGAWYNPLTYPARIVKGVGAVGRGTGRGIGGLFKGMWARAMKKESLL